MVVLFLVFKGISILSSIVAVSAYIPTSKQESPALQVDSLLTELQGKRPAYKVTPCLIFEEILHTLSSIYCL